MESFGVSLLEKCFFHSAYFGGSCMLLHGSIYLLLLSSIYRMYTYHNLVNNSVIQKQLGCFQFWVIMNNAPMSVSVHLFEAYVFSLLLGKYLGVARWVGGLMSVSFYTKLADLVQGGWAILHTHQQWKRMPAAPHLISTLSCQPFKFSNCCMCCDSSLWV